MSDSSVIPLPLMWFWCQTVCPRRLLVMWHLSDSLIQFPLTCFPSQTDSSHATHRVDDRMEIQSCSSSGKTIKLWATNYTEYKTQGFSDFYQFAQSLTQSSLDLEPTYETSAHFCFCVHKKNKRILFLLARPALQFFPSFFWSGIPGLVATPNRPIWRWLRWPRVTRPAVLHRIISITITFFNTSTCGEPTGTIGGCGNS